MSTKTTAIRVRRETYDGLSKQGAFGDSFDSVIQRMIEERETFQKMIAVSGRTLAGTNQTQTATTAPTEGAEVK
jgi:predicted CopG family antitoxin